jgi:hypothetical protein
MQNANMNNPMIEHLEKSLKEVQKPDLSGTAKVTLKNNILNSIKYVREGEVVPSVLSRLIANIKKIGRKVRMPISSSVMLKERLVNYAGFSDIMRRRRPDFGWVKVYGGGLLLGVFVVAVVMFPFGGEITRAKALIRNVKGEVFVLRDKNLIEAREEFNIEEGDTIMTKENSSATVYYFDDSRSKLDENTNIKVKRLYSEPTNPLSVHAEIYLEEGQMWAKVPSLTHEEAKFEVETDEAEAIVTNKAAFNLQVDEDATKLLVFNNVVDFKPVNTVSNSRAVVGGYKAQVKGNINQVDVQPLKKEDVDFNNQWVVDNLSEDIQFEDEMTEEKEQKFVAEKKDVNIEDAVLENPELEEQKKRFIAAYDNLVEAESMLVKGLRTEEAAQKLEDFQTVTADVLQILHELQADSPEEADILRQYIEEKIAYQLKDLNTFVSGDKLYKAKEIVQSVQLFLAEGDVQKTKVKLSQAEQKLLEVQKLVDEGKPGVAAVVLVQYKDSMTDFVLQVDSSTQTELKQNVVPILKQQLRQLKVLAALEESLRGTENVTLLADVTQVRRAKLTKLMNGFEKFPETVPEDLLYELKDISDTYFAGSSDDLDMFEPFFDKMLNRDQKITFISPDEDAVPTEIGVVLVIDTELESTPDVESAVESENGSQDPAGAEE